MSFHARRLMIINLALLSSAGLVDLSRTALISGIGIPVYADSSLSTEVNSAPEKPQGLDIYVNDYGRLLNPEDRQLLQARLEKLDEAGITQVSVLTIPSTSRELAELGPEIMNRWGIQHKGRKDGLLILVNADAVMSHKRRGKIFVATGYRIEGILPDARVGRILDETAIPAFEQGDYSKGITAATLTFAAVLQQSPELKGNAAPAADSPNWFVILGVLFGLFFMSKRLQRSSRGMYSGGGPFFGGGYYGGEFDGNDSGGGFGGGDDSSGGGGAER